MERARKLRWKIVDMVTEAKTINEKLFAKAQELEAEGKIREAYEIYSDIVEVGFLDDILDTGEDITKQAFERMNGIATAIRTKALKEIDSKPFSELTYGEYTLNGACCRKLRDAFEHSGISLTENYEKKMLCVDNYYKIYDEIDENMDVRSYNYGVFVTDECPFCGKKLKESAERREA